MSRVWTAIFLSGAGTFAMRASFLAAAVGWRTKSTALTLVVGLGALVALRELT